MGVKSRGQPCSLSEKSPKHSLDVSEIAHFPDEANNDCNNQDDDRNYTDDDNYVDDTNYGDDSNYDNFNATVSDIFADNKDIFSCWHCD